MELSVGVDAIEVIHGLNRLHEAGTIPDYALVGGVAALLYSPPRFTKDVGVMIMVRDTLREYPKVWSTIRESIGTRVRGQMILVGRSGTQLDVLATGGNEFDEEVVRTAVKVRAGREVVKVARPEYLIVMSLQAFRPEPDWGRIASLYLKSNPATLDSLLLQQHLFVKGDAKGDSALDWRRYPAATPPRAR